MVSLKHCSWLSTPSWANPSVTSHEQVGVTLQTLHCRKNPSEMSDHCKTSHKALSDQIKRTIRSHAPFKSSTVVALSINGRPTSATRAANSSHRIAMGSKGVHNLTMQYRPRRDGRMSSKSKGAAERLKSSFVGFRPHTYLVYGVLTERQSGRSGTVTYKITIQIGLFYTKSCC